MHKGGKQRQKVSIICLDGTSIKGFVCLNEGERLLDSVNDTRESFIGLTKVEFSYTEDIQSFKLATGVIARKDFIILNKSSIKWIEEIS